jgi:GNAT superfamily N-acetyltransferase
MSENISIQQATLNDHKIIASIGKIAVEEAHRDSCSVDDMNEFLQTHYNHDAIKEELSNTHNIYHIIYHNGIPAGFTKIILNSVHPNIKQQNVTKLDRIYLLKEFFNLKLGYRLLQHIIKVSKKNDQSGMWLFTWIENQRAVNFYHKTGFTIIGAHRFKVTENHYNAHHHMMLTY